MKDKKPLSKLRGRPKKVVTAIDSAVSQSTPASERFRSDLAVRGEAAEVDEDGKLPGQATHVITKKNADGTIEVKRARFRLA